MEWQDTNWKKTETFFEVYWNMVIILVIKNWNDSIDEWETNTVINFLCRECATQTRAFLSYFTSCNLINGTNEQQKNEGEKI